MTALTKLERRATVSLALVYAFRMFGLFLVLPVLAVYAQEYPDYSRWLVGLAIGAYGLTQALLQIPLGWLSDRVGRLPVIIGGLLLFALGSVIAAMSTTLWGVIIGRALQGSGAIAAALMALASDVTRDHVRSKVMAAMGMSIGASFLLALVTGPVLAPAIGLPGLFGLTAILSLVAILLVVFAVPKPVQQNHHDSRAFLPDFRAVMADGQLRRLNFAIFVLHFSLSAIFVSIPQDLVAAGFQRDHLAWVYAPVMVGSFLCMLPLMILAEKRRRHVRVLQLGLMFVLGGVVVWLIGSQTATAVVVGLAVFFLGFNLLESLLPSLLSRIAPQALKGTALGVYSTGQFVGAFTGATSAGWLLQRQVSHGNLAIVALLLLICLLSTIGLRGPTNG